MRVQKYKKFHKKKLFTAKKLQIWVILFAKQDFDNIKGVVLIV